MKSYFLINIVLLGVSLLSQTEEIELGKPLPKNVVIIDSSKSKLLETGPSSLEPSLDIQYNHINYSVVLSKEKKASFIITWDHAFKTKEGFKIGTLYKDVRMKYKGNGRYVPGYCYYIKLNSGWNALFSNDKIFEEEKPSDSDSIKGFYKGGY